MSTVTIHGNARSFLERAEDWLLEAEAEHNVILANAHLLAAGTPVWRPPIYLATVQTDSSVEGCIMRPPPDGAFMTSLPAPALPTVVTQLAALYDALPEAWGPAGTVREFAETWAARKGCRWTVQATHVCYATSRIVPPAHPPRGAARLAGPDDLDMLRRWAASYAREIPTAVDVPALFESMVSRRCLYVWDDGRQCSAATLSGFTPNGARISAVYTPPAFRNRGYASALVAAVTRIALDDRRFCTLLADAANPTSNRIYSNVGYEPLSEVVQVRFYG